MKNRKIHIRVVKGKLHFDYFFRNQRIRQTTHLDNTPENIKILEDKKKEIIKSLNEDEEWLNKHGFYKEQIDDKKVQVYRFKESLKELTSFKLLKSLDSFFLRFPKNKQNRDLYLYSVKSFIEIIGDKEVKDINPDDYTKFKEELLKTKSYETARTYINYLRLLFNGIKTYTNAVKDNPFIPLKAKENEEIKIISENHLETLFNELVTTNKELYYFIKLLRYTGFRKNELYSLKWSDINFETNFIIVTNFKVGEKKQLFPLNLYKGKLREVLLEMFHNRNNESDRLFKMNRDYYLKTFQKTLKKMNLPSYSLHDLRRTFGSDLAKTLKPVFLSKLMRHRDIRTTMKYYLSVDLLEIEEMRKGEGKSDSKFDELGELLLKEIEKLS